MKLDPKTPLQSTVTTSAVVVGRGPAPTTAWVGTAGATDVQFQQNDVVWTVTCCSGSDVYFRIVAKGATTGLASSSVYHGAPLSAGQSANYRVGINFELSVISASSSVVTAVANVVTVPV